MFKLTKRDKSLLTTQRPLIENGFFTYAFLQFRSKFRMEFRLSIPYLIEFIDIVLPIEYLILEALVRIALKLGIQILSHCHILHNQHFAPIANLSKITAG